MEERHRALKRLGMIASVALALAGCGPDTSPINATPFDGIAQEPRIAACAAEHQRFVELGVWVHGGATPGVNYTAWDHLDATEQERLIATAACLALGGRNGERIVTVEEAGGIREIIARRVVIAP